jgi:2-keto-4-pentenoate hydratase
MSVTSRDTARFIWDLWSGRRRVGSLPADLKPASLEAGFAVQSELPAVTGQARAGWKIAATSAAGQAHIGVDGPLPGTLLSGRVSPSPARFSLEGNLMRVAEPEFAFRMARSLPPRSTDYSQAEVLDAVASLHPAIEIPDSRYEDFARVGAAQLVADSACASWFAFGAAAPESWRTVDLSRHPVPVAVNGKPAGTGCGSNVLGDPRIALTWLANALSRLGAGLAAGEIVTTGTCLAPVAVAPGDTVTADFGRFGRAEVSFPA